MATYDLTTTTPSKFKKGDILNCPYSGSVKSITLPKGIYKLEVWGAQGGYRSSSSYGGKGGYSAGTLTLAEKKSIYLYSGGSGKTGKKTNSIYSGGFNGGGYRYNYYGGGGASDIRIGTDSLYARVIVAGGGGSDGATNRPGKPGGGESGGAATESFGSYGYGGTQTGNSGSSSYVTSTQKTTNSGSSSCYNGFGFGGFGCYSSSGYAGAGGGGWYGGCGSYPDGSGDDDRGGGGGSGYIYTASTASSYPSGCLLNSSYYLTDTQIIAGNKSFLSPAGSNETGHSGNGYCRITVIECSGLNMFIKIPNPSPTAGQTKTFSYTNLVTDSSFENGNWTGNGSRSTEQHKYGDYSWKMTGTGASEVLAYSTCTPQMIAGHKYYCRYEIYHTGVSGTVGMYWPEAEPYFFEGEPIGSANSWNIISKINTRDNWGTTTSKVRIDYNNGGYNSIYVDGFMLIDLTADFGSGKEPDKDWCDKNIPYFEGTYTREETEPLEIWVQC